MTSATARIHPSCHSLICFIFPFVSSRNHLHGIGPFITTHRNTAWLTTQWGFLWLVQTSLYTCILLPQGIHMLSSRCHITLVHPLGQLTGIASSLGQQSCPTHHLSWTVLCLQVKPC
ncbi:hypothetical protein NP493_331g05054 [Ridgeia piscesae]|uniref:Uncharacterized protein n=1 Tax=Ridgeia piscesae TaxID=27915 RepID=A0AAD9L4V3_RIDPI|nr:hypothetical protein NP493_331g05054 [Ridgeia piscesae]